MANLAFSQTIYSGTLTATPTSLKGTPMTYADSVAFAAILGDEYEVVTLEGTDSFAGYTRNKINLICPKDNHNYGFFLCSTNSSSNYYLRVCLYHKNDIGGETYKFAYMQYSGSNYSNQPYNVRVRTLNFSDNLRLINFAAGSESYQKYDTFFVTTVTDYSGKTMPCFCVIGTANYSGSTDNRCVLYACPSCVSSVMATVGEVSDSYMTYIGLQQVIDSVQGIVVDNVFFTTHRADSVGHFIEVEGVKFYSLPNGDGYNQYYLREVVG